VTDYLLLQINKQIDIINVKNTKTQENNDLEDEAKIYLSTQNTKKIALLKKMNTQVQKATHGKAVIEFISSKLHDDKFMNKIDINEFMLPIKNGKILNLKTLEVRDRTINDYFSYEIDVNYTPKQKHANKFFRELMKDDKSKLSVLQRMLGYSITSNIESKCYFVLIGAGDNGKSAMMRVIQTIFKPLFMVVQQALLFEQNKMKTELGPYLAILAGKRFGIYNEPSDNLHMNEAVIKSITGGDEVVAKKLYCDPFTFTPVIKMWILTNKNINFDVSSPAMVKRTKIVPMDAEFSDKPTEGQYRKDPQFVEDLQTIYKDEVFSFIAQGAYEYYKYKSFGDEECESINKYKTEYIDNQDDVKAFLNEKCIIDENLKCKISTTELFEAYIDFCKEHELRMIKREEFYKRLGSKKLNSCKLHGNWYYKHIKLKPFDNSYNEEIIDDDEIIEKEPKSIKCYTQNKIETVSESESDEEEEVIKKEEIIIPVPKKADKKIVVKKIVAKKEKILHMIDETDDEHYSDAENIKELF